MTGTPLEEFGDEYSIRVRLSLPESMSWDNIHVFPSGFIVSKNPDGKTIVPLGCPKCLGLEKGQDTNGYPTIGGEKLIYAEDLGIIPKHVSSELRANIWLCPGCHTPITDLIPQYETELL